ncbi:MAG: hypothetical protein ABR499_19405 [Gemmatimonadaceae bacterium]
MENALPLFALAAVVAAGAFAIRAFADWWLRAKQLERGDSAAAAHGPLAGIDARLERIEQVVEATAVEVERIAEAQRFTARLLAEQRPSEALLPRGGRAAPEPD